MNIGIIGATGFIGRHLAKEMVRSGHRIVAISRDQEKAVSILGASTPVFEWDSKSHEGLLPVMESLDALVNLAGYSLDSGRWTPGRKERIYNSRIATTNMVSKAILASDKKPLTLIQTSAIGIYGTHYDGTGDPPADGFIARVCSDWEKAAQPVSDSSTRLVINRFAAILGEEGMLAKLKPMFNFYAGGHIGNGKQWLSWIHIDDVVQWIIHALENAEVTGPVDVVAPQPLMQKEFFKIMAKVMDRPYWFHVPSFMVKLAFGQMGEETILASQRILPDKMLEKGFSFKYPDATSALEDLMK